MGILTVLLIAALIGGFSAVLSWDTIQDWIRQRSTRNSAYAEVIRTALGSGQYRLVAGMFDRTGNRLASTSWGKTALDEETRRKFGTNDSIRISVE